MADSTEYYVVKQSALPEVLLKVVEAKRLVESKRAMSTCVNLEPEEAVALQKILNKMLGNI